MRTDFDSENDEIQSDSIYLADTDLPEDCDPPQSITVDNVRFEFEMTDDCGHGYISADGQPFMVLML